MHQIRIYGTSDTDDIARNLWQMNDGSFRGENKKKSGGFNADGGNT